MIKTLSTFFCLLFIGFAALQYNDPDPIFWTILYLIVALISFLRIINKQNKVFVQLTLLALISIALFYVPGFIEWLYLPEKGQVFGEMAHDKAYIEETREFIGLLMGAGSVYYQYRNI